MSDRLADAFHIADILGALERQLPAGATVALLCLSRRIPAIYCARLTRMKWP